MEFGRFKVQSYPGELLIRLMVPSSKSAQGSIWFSMYLELYVAHLKGIISIQRRTFSKEQHLAFSKEQNFPLQRRTFNANTITAILSWRAPYSSEGSLFKVCPRLNLIFNVYSSIISLQRRTFSKEQHLAFSKEQHFPFQRRTFKANTTTASWGQAPCIEIQIQGMLGTVV